MTVLFGNSRAPALKWCAFRIYRIKITDFTGQNVSFFLWGKCVLACKIRNFYPMYTWRTPFWSWHSAISKMYNYVFLLQILWEISAFEWWTALGYFSYDGFSVKWHFIFKLLWRHVKMIFIQMLLEIIKCPTNTKKMRYFSMISDEYKCSKNSFYFLQLAMITLYKER